MIQRSLTLGIDMGGTSIRVGVYDETMKMLASQSMPTNISAGPHAGVREMAIMVRQLLAAVDSGDPALCVMGLGIGSPGPINLRTGVLGLLPNLPGWESFPLRDELAHATGLAVTLESDANAAAIAEWRLGAGAHSGLSSMVMLTLGTGVGSGLILNSCIWHGMFGMGGEVGHASVEPEGLACSCGSRGCLEMYASAKGLTRLAIKVAQSADGSRALRELVSQPSDFTPKDLAELAGRDQAAAQVFRRYGHYLGMGVANVINVLDPPMIVIGGGVAAAWKLFSPAMFETVRDYSVVYRLVAPSQVELLEEDRTFIRPALLGHAAGMIGAALLPRLLPSAYPVNGT